MHSNRMMLARNLRNRDVNVNATLSLTLTSSIDATATAVTEKDDMLSQITTFSRRDMQMKKQQSQYKSSRQDQHRLLIQGGANNNNLDIDINDCSSMAALQPNAASRMIAISDSSSGTSQQQKRKEEKNKKDKKQTKAKARTKAKASTNIKHSKAKTYILKAQWSKLRKHLATEEGCDDLLGQHMFGLQEETIKSKFNTQQPQAQLVLEPVLLHMACQGHPPLHVIWLMCAINPSWVDNDHNCQRHTPLHVASKWGAHPAVVEFLVSLNPSNAAKTDSHGRTPLHLHCEFCGQDNRCDPFSFMIGLEEDVFCLMSHDSCRSEHHMLTTADYYDHDKNIDDPSLELISVLQTLVAASKETKGPIPLVVQILDGAAPRSINQQDERGWYPVDYCINTHQSYSRRMVMYLEQLSERQLCRNHEDDIVNIDEVQEQELERFF
jgi:hypothetical protein